MNLRGLSWRAYRLLRRAAWSAPLARSPLWAGIYVRVGYALRRLLGLTPQANEVATVHGSKMMFGDASECYVDMVNDIYEPEITELFEKLLKPGMVVVDVGAHIGYYTLLAARQVGPAGRVYAFEPAPANYETLMKNIALNGCLNVTAIQKAVCDVQGTASFFMHMDSVAHSLHPTTLGRGRTAITVETTSLDHFFGQEGWPTDAIVKIDAEGAELAALNGMTGLIARAKKVYLFLEYIPQIQRNAGINPKSLIDKLGELGFSVNAITGDGLKPLDDKACEDYTLHADLFCVRTE